MKLAVALIIGVLAVTGCQTNKEPRIVNQTIVISPPANLFNCPQLGKLPNWQTATNDEIAAVIEKLYRYNKICKINMDAIASYVAKAEAALKERDTK